MMNSLLITLYIVIVLVAVSTNGYITNKIRLGIIFI